MCRLTAAHKTIRLMLLGSPPDMVHGVSLHRARTPIFRNNLIPSKYLHYYIIFKNKFQVFYRIFIDFLEEYFQLYCKVNRERILIIIRTDV